MLQCLYIVILLVSWCFEPSQPQRITSGLNTNFTLSPSYSFHKSLYYKSSFFSLSLSQTTPQILSTISERKTRKTITHVLEPTNIPWALNKGTFIQQGDLFYSIGLHRNRCWPQPTQEKIGGGFRKNAGEWTGRVEISKDEISGSKRSMFGYILTYSRL